MDLVDISIVDSEEAIFRSDVTKKLSQILDRLALLEEAHADAIRYIKQAKAQLEFENAVEGHPGADVKFRDGHVEVTY